MDRIELLSGDRNGIEVSELSVNRYCSIFNEDSLELIEYESVGLRVWAKNLIDPSERNPHKNEDRDVWEAWFSFKNYGRLLDLLEGLSFDEYDDVNKNDIAYTSCTSQTAICFVCGDDLVYREDDVVSVTNSFGPIYCHPDCVDEFRETIRLVEEHAPEIVARIV